jgi:hypothetical protein
MDLSRFGFRAGFDPDNKWVKQDKIKLDGKEFLVSTIDLGLDHSFGGGKPLYYETMIFAIENGEVNFTDLYCNRYSTKEEAEKEHGVLLDKLANGEITLEE